MNSIDSVTVHFGGQEVTLRARQSSVPLLPRADYRVWQIERLKADDSLFRLRIWGDPILGKTTDSLSGTSSNFQAIGLYNKATGFGGVTNYLWLSRSDIDHLAAMQIEDEYIAKIDAWRDQKMRWLCKPSGTIYFYGDLEGGWTGIPRLKWGTIALGGNLVTVEEVEILTVAMDGMKSKRAMARLAGFRRTDWTVPLDELLARGLVHRCFCAYAGNGFGDSPKGIVYSPFYSPLDWDFAGNDQPTALYVPFDWLEPK